MLKSSASLIDLEKLVSPQATNPCDVCDGSRRCFACGGTGSIGGSDCNACWNSGKCSKCEGKGWY